MPLLAELRRRNVFRVAVAYLVGAWVLLQIADVVVPALRLPSWTLSLIMVLLALAFVPVLVGAWIYELTPEGLRRESEVERHQSVAADTGRKLNIATIVMVLVGIGMLAADRYLLDESAGRSPAADEDGVPVIAILPFEATGSDDGGFLASGLHDDLLTMLHKVGAFRVVSRTSVKEYADSTKKMRVIRAELGASHILEGGVQAIGNRVRINAQLIDTTTDEHLWADIYDDELTAANLFEVQAKLATAIAEQLHRTLSPKDRAILEQIPTHNTEAYSAYLRSREVFEREGYGARSNRQVVELLENAVGLDPGFAVAWARLSEARTRLARLENDPAIREAALVALTEALRSQPGLVEADIAWATYLYHGRFEYEQALGVLERLDDRARHNPDVLLLKAWLYRRLGRNEDGYQVTLELLRRDRRRALADGTLVDLAIRTGHCADAADYASAGAQIAPDSVDLRAQLATYELECTGDAARASELMEGMTYGADWHLWVARTAAYLERDADRQLELAEISLPEPAMLGDFRDWEYRAGVLRDLGRETEVNQCLARMDQRLAEAADDERIEASTEFAIAKFLRLSYDDDAEALRYWIAEHKRRFTAEFKGDRYFGASFPWLYAWAFVELGLHDEAVEELRTLLEEPVGHRFSFIDATPAFDVLKDHPGYIELRERYGD